MEKINTLIGVRERTVKEIRERLARAEFTPEEVDDAVATAVRVNLINEERYARAFIRGKIHCGWGRHKIVQRLQMNGLNDETIRACEDEFSSREEEVDRARAELVKKPATSKDPYATYMRRLLNRGFSYDISSRAVKEHMAMQG